MKKITERIPQTLAIVLTFTIVMVVSGLIAQKTVGLGLAHVIGYSMDPNLKEGQVYLYAERSPIKRYDVVLSSFNDYEGGRILVKRVIGVPGDDLAVIDGKLYINQMYYEEPYLIHEHPEFDTESFRKKLGPNEYFLMGDNRDHSMDSRNGLGIAHKDNIKGVLKRDLSTLKKDLTRMEKGGGR